MSVNTRLCIEHSERTRAVSDCPQCTYLFVLLMRVFRVISMF